MAIQSNFPAIKPSLMLDFANTKSLDPRITFTRASTATYYDGVTTAMAEQNLFTYSEQFDNAAWTKTNATVTANSTTAPDGTTTADTLFETTTNGQHRVFISAGVTGTYTISVYAKAAGRDYVALWFGGVDKGKFFYIPAGGAGSVGGNFVNAPDSASITYVGNDWYRCSVTVSGLSGSAQHINACLDATTYSYAGDVTKGVHIWGAQLEQRSAVTAYTATTTQAITNYIPVLKTAASGVARFDSNPTTDESLGLLIEEQRTNLLTYSSDYSNAAWTKEKSSITADTIVAPDGTLTGDKINENTSAGGHGVYIGITATNVIHSGSVYLKAGERTKATVFIYDVTAATVYEVKVDLSNGTVIGTPTGTAVITSVGNGWYRVSITSSSALVVGTSRLWIRSLDASANDSYTGNGFSGIYIWGAQLEAGAFATSYIPTVASQVTRSADAASMTGTNFTSWYNAGEGTLYGDVVTNASDNTRPPFVLNSNSYSTNSFLPCITYSNTRQIRTLVYSAGAVTGDLYPSTTYTVGQNIKYAGSYKVNDFAISANGTSVTTDTSGTVPIGLDRLDIGSASGLNVYCGTIKKIAYYPLRVTNAQLQALTS